MTVLRLATSIEEMNAKFDHFRTDKAKEIADAFVPDPTDIIIAPHPKSGTTWTQQIVHSLRTRGDMDFEEITAVVPWIDVAYDLGHDLDSPQKAQPRAFKSHDNWDDIHKGARYIYVVRNPKDVAVSMYNFLGDWIFATASISIREFVDDQLLSENWYWQHIDSWWSQFDNPDVLFLCYEDMKADLDTTIQQIANFMQIELDDELFNIVRRNVSFEFMKAHNRQFDDHLIRDNRNAAMHLPPSATTSKVKAGNVGGYKRQLPQDLIAEIESRWKTATTPAYSLTDYEVVREKIQGRNIK